MAKKKQGALKPRKGLLPGQYKKTSTVAVELVDTLSEGDGLYITRRFIIDTERLDGNYSFTIEHRGVEWKIPGAVFRRMVQQVEAINKVLEGRPHIVDAIKNGQIDLVFNTTEGAQAIADSRSLRQATLLNKIPYCTTLAASRAMVQAIAALKSGPLEVRTLQSYAS